MTPRAADLNFGHPLNPQKIKSKPMGSVTNMSPWGRTKDKSHHAKSILAPQSNAQTSPCNMLGTLLIAPKNTDQYRLANAMALPSLPATQVRDDNRLFL
jgi:hypothetical protein